MNVFFHNNLITIPCLFSLAGCPRTKSTKPVSHGHPFQHFARKNELDVNQKYAPRWGRKRCKMGRVIKPRIDPRVSWPCMQDFQSRFKLPRQCVEELTDEFERSPFRPGKGKHEKGGSPIPLFRKVIFLKNINIYPSPSYKK